YDNVFPVLKRLGLAATMFVVSETLTPKGRVGDWVDPPPVAPPLTLTLDQVLEMHEAGVRIESHSHCHFDLTTLDPDACERDLRTSREFLEDLLKRPVAHLAYPRTRHDEGVR